MTWMALMEMVCQFDLFEGLSKNSQEQQNQFGWRLCINSLTMESLWDLPRNTSGGDVLRK
jgi:hypothetical protein